MFRVLGFDLGSWDLAEFFGFRVSRLGLWFWFRGFGIWLWVLGLVLWDLALGLGFRDLAQG